MGTNVWFFAYAGDTFATDQIADEYENGSFLESLVSMFVYGKMLSLLTIMFGVGLELKYQQAKRKNTTWPGTYLWILLFLFIASPVQALSWAALLGAALGPLTSTAKG